MNPTHDPQQPPLTPPTPAPQPSVPPVAAPVAPVTPTPAPQPFGAPVVPVSPFASSNPLPPATTPVTSGYGAGIMGTQPESTSPIDTTVPKKALNKKLILIIAAVVVVIAIAVILFLALKPGASSNGGVVGAIKSTVAPASQLTPYNGAAFTISYPKTMKPVDISSSVPSGSEAVRYSTNGQTSSDGSISSVGVGSTPYTSAYPRATQLKSFESSASSKVADTATSKDVTFTQTTYQGFEAFKETGTVLKDGSIIANATTEYIFGNKNLYILSINVTSSDASTIGAESDTILSSLKINE